MRINSDLNIWRGMKRTYYKLLQFDRIINADTQVICMYDIIQECDNSSRQIKFCERDKIKMTRLQLTYSANVILFHYHLFKSFNITWQIQHFVQILKEVKKNKDDFIHSSKLSTYFHHSRKIWFGLKKKKKEKKLLKVMTNTSNKNQKLPLYNNIYT